MVVLASGSLGGCSATGPPTEQNWKEEPHHFSVLSALTFEGSELAPSVGLDYEYRTSEFLGLGSVLEYAFENIDATTLLAVADLHFTPSFIMQTGPGVEWIEGTSEFVYRLGVLYEWEISGLTISPQIHYDFTSDDDAIITGVACGFAF